MRCLARSRRGAVAAALALLATPVGAVDCHVPGDYPSVGEAAAVTACSGIVLAAGVHTERVTLGRHVALRGADVGETTLRGTIQVVGASSVDIASLTIDPDGCFELGIEVAAGASVQAAPGDFAVIDSGAAVDCPLFRDGFETGNTGRWGAS